jgi:DNA-3-methyladenine glycosylase I
MPRCPWATTEPAITYHDEEWGVPVHDDRVLFEFLILEGAQAGLSWNTILKKRENYRKALDGFRPEKIARYNKRDVQRLLRNDGIVRNRLKIAATIDNAKRFLEVRKEFGTFALISGPSLAASRYRILGEHWLTYPRALPNPTR